MRINMTKDEMITKKDVKAALAALQNGEAGKGATVRTLFAGGLSVKEISDITAIRYNHVYNVCTTEVRRAGLEDEVSKDREGDTKKSQILTLLKDGKTVSEVSKELGCLYNQVWQIAKAAGFTQKQKTAADPVGA